MHEVAIAPGILEIAERYTAEAKASFVPEIVLDIGTVSGVVVDALEFALESVCKGTIIEKAKIITNEIPATGPCLFCGEEFNVEAVFAQCPACEEYNINIIQGKELKVRSLVVE